MCSNLLVGIVKDQTWSPRLCSSESLSEATRRATSAAFPRGRWRRRWSGRRAISAEIGVKKLLRMRGEFWCDRLAAVKNFPLNTKKTNMNKIITRFRRHCGCRGVEDTGQCQSYVQRHGDNRRGPDAHDSGFRDNRRRRHLYVASLRGATNLSFVISTNWYIPVAVGVAHTGHSIV